MKYPCCTQQFEIRVILAFSLAQPRQRSTSIGDFSPIIVRDIGLLTGTLDTLLQSSRPSPVRVLVVVVLVLTPQATIALEKTREQSLSTKFEFEQSIICE
jgi:hypothetical protein